MNHETSRASSNPSTEVGGAGGLPRLTASEGTWAPTPVAMDAFAPTPAGTGPDTGPDTAPATLAPNHPAPTGWSPTSWRIDR